MAEVLLGIDIGTGSTKGVITHPDGEIIASADREHGISSPRPGHYEHDPERVWWSDVSDIIAELRRKASGPIRALSVSGLGATTLPADADGAPVRDAISYGIDTRAGDEMAELLERYGAEEIVERSLSRLSHQSIGPKLLWIQRNEPEVWERTRQLLMANSFIVERLTGEYVLDSISASFCIPMFDPRERAWVDGWTEEIAPGLELPRILEPWEVAGHVTAEAAELTGLREGTPVCAGTIDAFVESASVGVREPGDVMLTYGTTMGIAGVLDEPRPSSTLNSTPGVFPGTHIMIGPTATSGALTDWVRNIADGKAYEELLAEAADITAGADGLVVLPYWAGERTPIWDPDARGVIAGLTVDHTRGHLYRAMLEATAYSCRDIFAALRDDGVQIERVVAVGGGTRGDLWPQIVSNVTGVAQHVSEVTMGACYGDALFAARAVDLVDDQETWARTSDTIEPDDEVADRYAELHDIYQQLYEVTKDQVHALTEIQHRGGFQPDEA